MIKKKIAQRRAVSDNLNAKQYDAGKAIQVANIVARAANPSDSP